MASWSILLSVLLVWGNLQSGSSTVKISLYYESLCPDSVRFVVNQLFPTYQKLSQSLQLDLIPYGLATTKEDNGQYSFTCQHGPNECEGNKVQACIDDINSQDIQLDFVNCAMSSSNVSDIFPNARECCQKLNIDWSKIEECISTGKADKLLASNGVKTDNLSPKLRYVPTIVFNDKFNQTIQDEAEFNLLATVCDSFTNPRPSGCPSTTGRPNGEAVVLLV